MGGLIDKAIEAGIESPRLLKGYQTVARGIKASGAPMDQNIQYSPKDIAAVCTLVKQVDCRTYLAIDSGPTGGARFIKENTRVDELIKIDAENNLQKEKTFFICFYT